ncbi:MAG: hypothetical protein Q3965_00960 [Rothia sp. (in: high G+C Gram-positive bacteria)]|nr:hypothetical protein [Rothia sp. (in: high G+C Gram-positive bacteria)]
MKNHRFSIGLIVCASLSLGMVPTGAHAAENINVNTDSAIGTYWAAHQGTLGAAVSQEVTYANGASEQRFENGVVTNGKWGGVQALTGAAGEAFVKAGGVEKFGNAESAPWNNSFCGTSVTTHDGKTRWMVVLDEKTQPGSYIDLNSAAAQQWRAERGQSGACFPNNAATAIPEVPVEAETPAPQPNAEATYGDAANKIAEARAQALSNGFTVAEASGELRKVTDDLVAQDFSDNISGLYSISQNRALMINTNAIDVYVSDSTKYGSYLYQNEFITNTSTGTRELRALFYSSAAQNCSAPESWDDHGYALFTNVAEDTVISQYFTQYDDYGTCINWNNQIAASPVSWGPGLMDRTAQGTQVDTTYDWSAATYLPIQQVLELRVDANKVVYIKADATGKPLAGASPVESSALTEAKNLTDRNRFSSYNDWAYGGNWNIWSDITMLGAPLEPATEENADDGSTLVTQKFEGGTLVWVKGTAIMRADLNDLGKAKLTWYNSLGI